MRCRQHLHMAANHPPETMPPMAPFPRASACRDCVATQLPRLPSQAFRHPSWPPESANGGLLSPCCCHANAVICPACALPTPQPLLALPTSQHIKLPLRSPADREVDREDREVAHHTQLHSRSAHVQYVHARSVAGAWSKRHTERLWCKAASALGHTCSHCLQQQVQAERRKQLVCRESSRQHHL